MVSGISLHVSSTLFIEEVSQSNPELTDLASLPRQFVPGIPSLPSEAEITGGPTYPPRISMSSGHLNSSPLIHLTDVLTSKPAHKSIFHYYCL